MRHMHVMISALLADCVQHCWVLLGDENWTGLGVRVGDPERWRAEDVVFEVLVGGCSGNE